MWSWMDEVPVFYSESLSEEVVVSEGGLLLVSWSCVIQMMQKITSKFFFYWQIALQGWSGCEFVLMEAVWGFYLF